MMKTQDRGQVPKRRKAARRYRAGLFEAEGAYADAMVRSAMGDFESSTEALRMALEWLPEYAPALFSLGTVEYQRGKRDEGRRLFQLLLAQPTDTSASMARTPSPSPFGLKRNSITRNGNRDRGETFLRACRTCQNEQQNEADCDEPCKPHDVSAPGECGKWSTSARCGGAGRARNRRRFVCLERRACF